MTETLKDIHCNEVNVDEIADCDDTTGREGGAPTHYVKLVSHFVPLKKAAEACGNDDASFYLQNARMSFI